MANKKPPSQDSADNPSGLWPVGEIPDWVLLKLGEQIVHRLAIGHKDLSGDDFGTVFANAIGGIHRKSPLGIIDVFAGKVAWSAKTISNKNPKTVQKVRLISGRNSPDYSAGISDPRKDPEATGRAVLQIWNRRVKEAQAEYDDLRIVTLIRNMEDKKFCLFEQPATKFPADDYVWSFNKHGNLEGHEKATETHTFTWQPHGSQFTVIRLVPDSARHFHINREIPPTITPEIVLKLIQYSKDWISLD